MVLSFLVISLKKFFLVVQARQNQQDLAKVFFFIFLSNKTIITLTLVGYEIYSQLSAIISYTAVSTKVVQKA